MSNLYYIGDSNPADSLNELIQYMEEQYVQYEQDLNSLIGQTVCVYNSTNVKVIVEGIIKSMNIGDEFTDRLFNLVGEENYDVVVRKLDRPELDIDKAIIDSISNMLVSSLIPDEQIKEFKITAEHIRKYHAWEGQDD